MARFRYSAVDPQGQPLRGEVETTNLAEARSALQERGLQILELQSQSESPGVMSSAEAFAVADHIHQATQNELPLAGSLRAFTEEVVSPRMRRRLSRVCDALEAGEPLDNVLLDKTLKLPRSLGLILGSGLPHQAMNHLLSLSVRAASTSMDLNIRAALLLCYPLIMVTALLGFWVFLLVYLTPQFATIYEDFGTELTPMLVQLIDFSKLLVHANWRLPVVVIPVIAALVLVFHFAMPAAMKQRFWCGLPIVGSMYRLTSLAEFARLLAVMLEARVPLPQALTWSAIGANDADLLERTDDVVTRLKSGADVVSAGQQVRGLPAYFEQMLRFAAQGPAAAEPLRSMAKLMETRAKSLSQVAMPLLEPMVAMAAVASIAIYVLTVFPPLVKLLNDLS